MTGKRMAEKMRQYGNALEAMSNEAVEYVRGIPAELYAKNGLYTHMVDLQSASQRWTI